MTMSSPDGLFVMTGMCGSQSTHSVVLDMSLKNAGGT
jgi:hypothetical protein